MLRILQTVRATSCFGTYRIPVVEIRIVSVDSKGVPVDPHHAARLSIDSYGPDHKFLSHTDASAHP